MQSAYAAYLFCISLKFNSLIEQKMLSDLILLGQPCTLSYLQSFIFPFLPISQMTDCMQVSRLEALVSNVFCMNSGCR